MKAPRGFDKTRLSGWGHVVVALWLSGCGKAGLCRLGDEASCPAGMLCYAGEEAAAGATGVCIEILKSWRLVLPGQVEVPPLRTEGSAEDNPEAGWVSAGRAAVEIMLWKLQPGEAVHLWAGEAAVACENQGPLESGVGEFWRCPLEEGWAVADPLAETVDIKLQLGEGAAHQRTYRIDAQVPLAGLLAGTACHGGACAAPGCMALWGERGLCPAGVEGAPLRVCIHAEDVHSGIRRMEAQEPVLRLGDSGEEKVMWQREAGAPGEAVQCWTGQLPAAARSEAAQLSVDVELEDQAGNTASWAVHGSPGRVACLADAGAKLSTHAIHAPLVWAGQHLAFASSAGEGAEAADNALYFFDTEACRTATWLHTGAVQGPMVALGGSGRLALALGGAGPEERAGPRLAVVEAGRFLYAPEKDCASGLGGSAQGALFEKGLALLSAGGADGEDEASTGVRWRFAAPANSAQGASRLMAYTPLAAEEAGRCAVNVCQQEPTALSAPFALTPAQPLDNLLLSIHGQEARHVGLWPWLKGGAAPTACPTAIGTLGRPSGMAVGAQGEAEQLWLSGEGLQRLEVDAAAEATAVLEGHWWTSPAAVDNEGRAYVVVQTHADSFELQRFAAQAQTGSTQACFVDAPQCAPSQTCMRIGSGEGLCQAAPEARIGLPNEAPVGSPLLGHPPGEPDEAAPGEIYVVTTFGTLQAFNADTLAPLWRQSLGLWVSPTAQPVLREGVLWLVGTHGAIRGIRVGSEALSRSAHWPKAFHDNCNTSSRQANKSMPTCF